MAKPDLSAARRKSSDILVFLAPPALILGAWTALMWFSTPDGQASVAANTVRSGATNGGAVATETLPPLVQIQAAASELASRQEVVSLSLLASDPEFYDQARIEGTCGVIGVDVSSVADVLYEELPIGALSPASDNIAVFVTAAGSPTRVDAYAEHRIGAANRKYVHKDEEVCIDDGLVIQAVNAQ